MLLRRAHDLKRTSPADELHRKVVVWLEKSHPELLKD